MTSWLLPEVTRRWFRLRWPHEVAADQLLAALLGLNGAATPRRAEACILRAAGHAGQVSHHLAVPGPRATGVRQQLEAAVPGLAVEPIDSPPQESLNRAWRAWFSTRERPLELRQAEAISHGVLTALGSAGADEHLVMQWALGPVRRPLAVGNHVPAGFGPGLGKWVLDVAAGPGELEGEARTALAQKQGLPGWRGALHLGVTAEGVPRQLQLLGRLSGAIRVSQAAGAQVGFRSANPSALATDRLPFRRPLAINVGELQGLAAWPVGATEPLPVDRIHSRLLAPAAGIASVGRVVGDATYPSRERPLALTARDSLQHLHVIGPTGTGKSTLLLNLIVQDMAQGRSVVVIEPKGDLVRDVLERVPDDRLDDVVVIDPTDTAPVGINPLAARGVAPDVRVDHLLAVFKNLFAESWGPRLQDILTAGLLTLTKTPGMSLVALPLLFTDAGFRRRLLSRVHDPLALGPFWAWFEELSAAERAVALAPVMNKLRAFLLRERLRRVVGQGTPRFDLRQVFTERKVLLVNAGTGTLGAESAGLLGSLVVSQLWQTAQGRSAIRPERRHPVMVVVDEFQEYLHLPTDLGDVLAMSRSLGVGLTLAHQHLGQLHPSIKAAVLANARSRVTFATNHDDATALTKGDDRLLPADVVGLGRFEAYASLMADNQAHPYASIRTHGAPPAVRAAGDVLARSRHAWGIPSGVVDAELEALATTPGPRRTDSRRDSRDDGFGVRSRGGKRKTSKPTDRGPSAGGRS